MILHRLQQRRLSDRNYGCRRRPRYLIFSQFSICCCKNAFASGALPQTPPGGFQRGQRPQLANVRPHDPPLPEIVKSIQQQHNTLTAKYKRVCRSFSHHLVGSHQPQELLFSTIITKVGTFPGICRVNKALPNKKEPIIKIIKRATK